MKLHHALLAIGLCLSGGAQAAEQMPFWGAKAPAPFETPATNLKLGEFTWAPQIAPSGPIMVLVSLDEQRAYTYRNNVLIGVATVSTGRKGFETPTGVFTTLMKDKNHHSSKYNNAAMPYTQRITNDGVALHAGGIPNYPSSHGCVHLPSEYARLLFDAAPRGMTVVIGNKRSSPVDVVHPAMLAPASSDGKLNDLSRLASNEPFRFHPEKSPEGPVSILISRADQRVLLMRNGIEIGRAKITLKNPEIPWGTHVYMVKEGVSNLPNPGIKGAYLPNWIGLGITGHMQDEGSIPNLEAIERIQFPKGFLEQTFSLIVPGTTMMVTDAAALESTTNAAITVFDTKAPEL